MRFQSSLLLILAGVLTSGCFKSTTTIELKPDGSGTIVQENAVGAEALALIKSFASSQNAKGGAPELFTQEQAMKTAETMGVTFVSGEPFKTGELEGYRARYRFDDISKIKMNMQQTPEGNVSAGGKPSPFGFTLTRGASSSTLTIQVPEPDGSTFPGLPGAAANDADKAQAAQAMAMMKMMMKGLFVDVSLAIDGRIIKSNATHVEGSKITLLQVDFDKLLADEASLKKLEAAKDLKSLVDVPGLKMPTESKVVIEFSQR